MASQADVRRIALSLPGTEEAPNHASLFDEDGFPAVLVRLPAVTPRELKPIITEAWRC